MKLINLFTLLFINISFSQSDVIVSYSVVPLRGSYENSDEIKNSNIRKNFEGVDNALKSIEFELIVSKGKSYFSVVNSLDFNIKSNRLAKVVCGTGEYFVQNNEVTCYREFMGEKFNIKTPVSTDWIMTDETKEVNGYKCFKATLKKINLNKKVNQNYEIVAWYCPALPINFGPKEYIGLPGLILELHDDKVVFLANKINLKPKDIIDIKMKKGTVIDEKNYVNMVNEKTLSFLQEKNTTTPK